MAKMIQLRHVPDALHRQLKARAALSGMPLSDYLIREVRKIVEDAHKDVVALLTEKRPQLDGLAHALLEHETLDEDDAYAAAGVEHEPSEAASNLAAAANVTAG